MNSVKTTNDLKDIHKDKLCFIFGAGPSLHFIDTEPLRDYVSITVNSGVLKAKWCDYFLSDDVGVCTWSYYTDVLPKLGCIKLLYKDKLSNKCQHLSNVMLFSHTWWYSPSTKSYNPPGICLTKQEPIIGAINSVGSAVHFAYIMGCNPVVLMGCDCSYKDGHRYFWQYEGEEKPHRVASMRVISDSYYEKDYTEKSLVYWNVLAESNKRILESEMRVFDSSDGILDCFPKMSIHNIMEEYGARKKG
jgi:hypothetical protein